MATIGISLKQHAEQAAGVASLSPAQVQILTMAAQAPHGVRPTEVAARLAVSPPTITESVKVLVRKHLLEKRPDPLDARAVRLHLTPEGHEQAQRSAGWSDFLAAASSDVMGEAEQEEFFTRLVKILLRLQERSQLPILRMCVTCIHFRPNVHSDEARPHHCALVDAPLGPRHIRLDCPEHAAEPDRSARSRSRR